MREPQGHFRQDGLSIVAERSSGKRGVRGLDELAELRLHGSAYARLLERLACLPDIRFRRVDTAPDSV